MSMPEVACAVIVTFDDGATNSYQTSSSASPPQLGAAIPEDVALTVVPAVKLHKSVGIIEEPGHPSLIGGGARVEKG